MESINFYKGKKCESLSDCGDSGYLICREFDHGESMCDKKDAFPLTEFEILGSVLLAFIMPIAIMAAVGGGGIVIPMLMLFFKVE